MVETVELFGNSVIPEFDTDPELSTEQVPRASAQGLRVALDGAARASARFHERALPRRTRVDPSGRPTRRTRDRRHSVSRENREHSGDAGRCEGTASLPQPALLTPVEAQDQPPAPGSLRLPASGFFRRRDPLLGAAPQRGRPLRVDRVRLDPAA